MEEDEQKKCVCGADAESGEALCKTCARAPWDGWET